MAQHRNRRRPIPRVEHLEAREAPSASPWLTESFDTTAAGALPPGWSGWLGTPDGSANSLGVASIRVLSPSNSLASSATSGADAGRAWLTAPLPADVQASAAVYLATAIPGQVLVRGSGLGTVAPSYYDVSVTSGMQVQLQRVAGGTTTVLGSLRSVDPFFNQWVRVTLDAEGSTLRGQVVAVTSGQYLNAQGQWQSAPAWALQATDTTLTGTGQVGLGRAAGVAGLINFDDFSVSLPNAAQSFDTTAAGSLPAGWGQWSSTGAATFQVSSARALSAPNGLASTAGSSVSARAWSGTPQPADVQAAASLYLDSLIPAGVLVRGSGLATATPSYYALHVARGLDAQLVRVVNGVATVLGEVRSAGYFSGQWLRATLSAQGSTLSVQLTRLDTGQYLNAQGQWQSAPATALQVTDTALNGPGLAGVERAAAYAGTVTLDDFAVTPLVPDLEPPQVQFTTPAAGATLTGVVSVQAAATDNRGVAHVDFYLDGVLRATATAAPYTWSFDSSIADNGTHTLTAVAYDAAGNSAAVSESVTTQNASALAPPSIPQHYPWIRIAELAYNGTPLGSFEYQLLKNSVDLVIPSSAYLAQINAVAPNTPQLIYTNVSSLYQGSLLDWLIYARANGLDPEAAFYHVTRATAFSGNSPSSQPVNWFWGVYRGGGASWTDLTSQSRGTARGGVTFGSAGQSVAIGYLEPFNVINFQLASAAANGWSGVLEYPTAVDAGGNPTAWAPVPINTDGTGGLTKSGQVTFDPPAGWKPASINGSALLYYVRVRTTSGGTAPVAATVLGDDYVHANGGTSGVIPAFDAAADVNHDGYLNNAEYAVAVAHGYTARFLYQSRLFAPSYGQMRLATDPSNSAFRSWAVHYEAQYLAGQPLADGLFVDNSGGKAPAAAGAVAEPVASYATDYGTLLNAIGQRIAPHWLLANTAGGDGSADPVIQRIQGYYEEIAIRPLANSWQQFETLAATVAERARLKAPAPYAVLDSLPAGGSPTDPRTQLATLAYYYLLADPTSTFLDFYGGYAPATSWTQHWSQAVTYNVGQPLGSWSLLAAGADPANPALTYHVYQRAYSNVLVLYKPLSYGNGTTGGLGDNTATTFALGGTYRALQADGTLGAAVTSITLRNGEGAILVKGSG
jgi:hypothetical protein